MPTRRLEPRPLLRCLWQAPYSSPNDISGWGYLTLSQCQKGTAAATARGTGHAVHHGNVGTGEGALVSH